LQEEIVYVHGWVYATSAFNQQQTHQKIANVTKTGVNLVETIGAVAGAIVAVGGLIGWLIMKARKRKPATGCQDGAATLPRRN
jgi:hypothetical protein